MTIPRELLAKAFPGQPRLVIALADQSEVVAKVADEQASMSETSEAMIDAPVVVLRRSTAFNAERVLTAGRGLELVEDGDKVTIKARVAVDGTGDVTFLATGQTTLVLPPMGTLATVSGQETLRNKVMEAPVLSGIKAAVNDAAAATAGVPVGGMYRDGSALKVRVA